MHRRPSHGFTLVELLVVIAIIGVLVALLLPAIQAAREAARRAQCQNSLKQTGLGVLNYDSAKGRFPPGSTAAASTTGGANSSTWTVDILPYAEQQALYALWDNKVDFQIDTSPGQVRNKKLRETFLSLYICPTDIDTNQLYSPESGQGAGFNWAPGSYRGVSGSSNNSSGDYYWDNPAANTAANAANMPDHTRGPLHAVLKSNAAATDRKLRPVSTKNIPDGTSNTLLVGEYHTTTNPSPTLARRTLWCYAYTSYNQSSGINAPSNFQTDYNACTDVHNCKRAWGSLHTGGIVQFAKCDGSVTSVNMNVDRALWVPLTTIGGEEQTAYIP
jgi:prepilin-type N-terminal cleavage/methylation domain-containing protein